MKDLFGYQRGFSLFPPEDRESVSLTDERSGSKEHPVCERSEIYSVPETEKERKSKENEEN